MKSLLAAFAILLSIAIPASAQTFDDGIKARDAGDYEKAKSIFLPLAEAGNAKAMNAIGKLYYNGWGYSKNQTRACDWFEKSATAGYKSAQHNSGICFRWGEGRKKNLDTAIHWYEKAANQGKLGSQIALLILYGERNPERAQYWGQKASDQGSVFARGKMWSMDMAYTGPKVSPVDTVCLLVMVGLMDKPITYCDY